jgi:alkylation response protein AidB-like acyl-CoA dehydrogenase
MSNPDAPSSSARPVVIGVSVGAEVGAVLADLAQAAGRAAVADDVVGDALVLAAAWGPRLPRPGQGRTAELWSALATLGAVDLTVARAVEPHLDALTILSEAGVPARRSPDAATWGVYAAESPTQRLSAVRAGDAWVLDGHKAWCSLAGRVSHALVTAWVDDSTRGLFAVDLTSPGVRPVPAHGAWVSHGLPQISSCGVDFETVDADPVGEPGWYLTRPGFAWGGVGVAAVWFGAAVAVARRVLQHVAQRSPDQIAHLQVGRLDLALSASREALAAAAMTADSADGEAGSSALGAVRARSVVAQTVETVIRLADHAMGPAPLAHDAEHAQRISDLRLYVRQHHAERDVADLGDRVLRSTPVTAPW